MGAWGMGPFENDCACDWVFELEEADGDEALAAAFAATQTGDYFEVDEGSAAVGAAEVVAAMLGNPRDDLPDAVTDWLSGIPAAEAAARAQRLVAPALAALDAVLDTERSEVAELWADAGGETYAEWRASLDDVRARLT